jgi:hypothetical protein
MRAVMHEQIPGIGNQRTRNESAACDQIDQRETNPYLPKNCENRAVGVGMMLPMFGRCEAMQHKAMNDIFGEGPCNDAAPASTFKMTSGGTSYQWQLAGGTDIMGGNGIGIASQRYCKVNTIADRSGTVVDLKTDDTGSATSYGYFTVTESLCAKRFGMKKEI